MNNDPAYSIMISSGGFSRFFFSITAFFATPLLLVLSFPPWNQRYLAWFGLLPLLLLIKRSGPVKAFLLSFMSGFLFLTGLHYWSFYIKEFTILSIFLGNLITAVPYGVFGLAAYYFNRRLPRFNILTLPAAWVLMEYARIHIDFLSWPLGLLAYSQYENLVVARLAAITGLYGVSFLVLVVNVMLAEFVWSVLCHPGENMSPISMLWRSQKAAICLFASTAVLAFPLVINGMATSDELLETKSINVAMVQGNTLYLEKPSNKSDPTYRQAVFQTYEKMTRTAAESEVDLISWPSSVIPGRIPYDSTLVKLLASLSKETGTHLLVGSAGEEKFTNDPDLKGVSNSAFLISRQGQFVGRYDKIHLLPFDEYLPLRGRVIWPSWIVSSFPSDYRPGKELAVFALEDFRFGVQICWENYFPDQFRRLADSGVDFIVSMTNEEGFTGSRTGHDQFLAINVFRAIENNIPVIRTATSGISAFIHPSGKVTDRVANEYANDVDVQGIGFAKVPVSYKRSFYTRHGDWFIGFLGILLAGFWGLAVLRSH